MRDLNEILLQILEILPEEGEEELRHALEDVQGSAAFASPENMHLWWKEAGLVMEDELGPPPYEEKWKRDVFSLFTGKESHPDLDVRDIDL
jgi:hypothetical protein